MGHGVPSPRGGRWLAGPGTTFGIAGTGQSFFQNTRAGSGLVRGGGFIEAAPLVRLDLGEVDLEVRTGLVGVWNEYAGERESWWIPSAWVVLEHRLSQYALLEATGRLVSVDGDRSAFAGLAATYLTPRWGAWGRGGFWSFHLEHAAAWSAGAYFQGADRVQLYASVHQEPDDPVHATTARRTWSIGLGFALDRGRRADPAVLPLEPGSRTVLFRLDQDDADGPPSIAGDFTGWAAHAMHPTRDGWEARFELAPGFYRFAFIDGNNDWFLPPSIVHRVDDGFGGENGVIVVR